MRARSDTGTRLSRGSSLGGTAAIDCVGSQSNAHARHRPAIAEHSGFSDVVTYEWGSSAGVRLRGWSALPELSGTVQI